jgi:septum formation protein
LTRPGRIGTPLCVNDHSLILASASPRRRQLLARAGIAFEVIPADIPEHGRSGEKPGEFAARVAAEKALTVARRVGPAPRRQVLGADTIVVIDDAILGKPRDAEHAVRLLERLVGRSHEVITAVAVAASDTLEIRTTTVRTRVTMRRAAAAELRAYVATGEPLDKAGAYALQGGGRNFIEKVDGSESNVIGLPLAETLALLGAAGGEGPAA